MKTWTRSAAVAWLVAFGGSLLADHGGPDGGRGENTPSFVTLGRSYDHKNSEAASPAFRLKDGDCHASSEAKVKDVFRLARFNANIEAPPGSSVYRAKFSDPAGKLGSEYEDETFHDEIIGLHYRSAKTGGGPGNMARNFTVPIVESFTYQKPRYFAGFRVGSRTVSDTRTRMNEVTISHSTRKSTFNGQPVYILKATGSSTAFGWNDTTLYYCVFPAK